MIVEFRPKGHKYTISVDGGKPFKPPSVTGITGVYDKSGAIAGWSVNNTIDSLRENLRPGVTYSEYEIERLLAEAKKSSYRAKQHAADIGTAAHDWLYRFLTGEDPELPPDDAPHRNSVDAGLLWFKSRDVHFLDNEKLIYSKKYKYSGRMDGRALLDGKTTIIDFKTGRIHAEARLQVSAYWQAHLEETGEEADACAIIRLNKVDGNFESQIIPKDIVKRDFKGFRAAQDLYLNMKRIEKEQRKLETNWLEEFQ